MSKLLVCIDGSTYTESVCTHAAWAAKLLNAEVDLLHVLRPHSENVAPSDHTGSISLGARSKLLEELTQVDEERGRLEQKKGKIILKHGEQMLKDAGVEKVNVIHRRGPLGETIQEFAADADIIFMGKRGDKAKAGSAFLGANLEKSARAIHKPLFVVSSDATPLKRFLIAFDGKENAIKAVDYITEQPLLKGLECHLLTVNNGKGDIDISEAKQKLTDAGFNVTCHNEENGHVDKAISTYIADKEIDLLITGAYSHSRIRSLLLGSTTASLIKSCKIPLLLFR
ncbi:MAG: universal stress protein [Proteobacteria bacterium]|nr:universal stress protein [Pseudomonadota bacterium]